MDSLTHSVFLGGPRSNGAPGTVFYTEKQHRQVVAFGFEKRVWRLMRDEDGGKGV